MHNIYKLKAVLCTHTHTRAHWPGTRCVPIPPPTLQGVLFPQGNNKKTTTCVMSCSRPRCCELRTHSRPRQRRRRFSISPGKRRHKTGNTRDVREQSALPHFLRRGDAAAWKETRWAKFTRLVLSFQTQIPSVTSLAVRHFPPTACDSDRTSAPPRV